MARILLADDDPTALELMTVALETEGHQVVCAANGKEAYIRAVESKPELVMLDIMMSEVDGYEACRAIRNDPVFPSDLPIIFLTSARYDAKRMGEAGGTDYLSKRHMIDELRDVLEKHLSH